MSEILLRGAGIIMLIIWCLYIYYFIFSKQANPPSKNEKLRFLATLDECKGKPGAVENKKN